MTARPEPRYSKEEFLRRGQAIYERDIRPQVKAGDEGKFVAVDIETGAYEMDRDETQRRNGCSSANPPRKSGSFESGIAQLTASGDVQGPRQYDHRCGKRPPRSGDSPGRARRRRAGAGRLDATPSCGTIAQNRSPFRTWGQWGQWPGPCTNMQITLYYKACAPSVSN